MEGGSFSSAVVLVLLISFLSLSTVAFSSGSGNGGHEETLTDQDLLPTTASSDAAVTTAAAPWTLCRAPLYSVSTRIRTVPPYIAEEFESQTNSAGLAIEGRCYLACAPNFKQEKVVVNNDLSSYWPYVTVANCLISRMVHECTRGCVVAYERNLDLFDNTCPQACLDNCTSECGDMEDCANPSHHDPWIRSQCNIQCATNLKKSTNACRTGCTEANSFEEVAGNRPLDPSGPPVLLPDSSSDRVGQFTVDLTGTLPRKQLPTADGVNNGTTAAINPVTFLFRFEEMTSHNVSYIWQANPFAQLDLANYACQELLVSFAVVNTAGLSNFSASTTIAVLGDLRLIPNPPVNLELRQDIDKRVGFFGHVILNISWERPENDAYLDNYFISVSPASGINPHCGNKSWIEIVSSNITSVIVQAETYDSLPVMECTYCVEVYSIGPDGNSSVLDDSFYMQAFDPECIDFDCKRWWQPSLYLFLFNLTWTVPPYIDYGNVIRNFKVNARIRDGDNGILNILLTSQVTVSPQANGTTNFILTSHETRRPSYHFPQHDTSWRYSIESFVTWNTDIIPFTPESHIYYCSQRVVSPAPSLVRNFSVTSYSLNDSWITLNMVWIHPLMPEGVLAPYNVCIGGEPLESQAHVQPHTGHFCGHLNRTGVIALRYFKDSICLFVQIRANNQYVPGNWSTPYIIPLRPHGLCQDPVPGPVEDLNVTSYCINNNRDIEIDFSWTPPSTGFNNEIAGYYNVCVSDLESVVFDDGFLQEFCVPVKSEDTNTIVRMPFNQSLLTTDEVSYLYLWMKANNVYGTSSSWGDPSPILLHSANTCAMQPVAKNSKHQTNAGVVAGSLFVCLLLITAIAVCIYLTTTYVRMAKRRRRLLRITQEPCDDPMFNSGPRKLLLQRPIGSSPASPLNDEWEMPANEVLIEDCLGEGAFGEVYKGIVKCPIINPKVRSSVKNAFCTPVAIKLLKSSAKGSERQDFLSEIEMMKKVAEGQNPHVVCLVGCVTIQEPLCLITEFIKYGDLLSYLKTNRKMYTGSMDDDTGNSTYAELGSVSPADLMSFAYQIASGMEYLSSLGIVHRDLACRNILVDEGKVLKITDFGMSRETDEIYVQKRTGRVPLKWMAIESIIAREFTSASDVWSYGVTLWEIGTLGGFPYPSIQNEDLLSLLKRGYRMEKPENCSTEVYDIMLMCWNEEPHKRPKFTDLRARFDAMLLAERKEAYIDLRIDNDKPYYRLDTAATIVAKTGPLLTPIPNRHSFILCSSMRNEKECSPKPLHLPTPSPCHGSQASCCSSAHQSPRKNTGLDINLSPSLNSFHPPDLCCNSCEQTQQLTSSVGESERRGRENSNSEGHRRPVSVLLPHDRERSERQNPYVDEPSRVAATALALPKGNGEHNRRVSDGAIELNHLGSEENIEQPVVHITVTGD